MNQYKEMLRKLPKQGWELLPKKLIPGFKMIQISSGHEYIVVNITFGKQTWDIHFYYYIRNDIIGSDSFKSVITRDYLYYPSINDLLKAGGVETVEDLMIILTDIMYVDKPLYEFTVSYYHGFMNYPIICLFLAWLVRCKLSLVWNFESESWEAV